MKSKPSLKKPVILVLLLAFSSVFIVSCKKSEIGPNKTPNLSASKSLGSVYYQWGDLSIDRTANLDKIKYDNTGKISSINSILTNGYPNITIAFTYQGNNILLNTDTQDIYQLDNNGRVSMHTSTSVQHSFTFISTEQYLYDSNGYLSEILMAVNGTVYSNIKYNVQNGNYTSYTLANTQGGQITREYDFTYSNTTTSSQFPLFTPVLGDNTFVAIEKYLNFGKQSVNVLLSVKYSIADEDGAVQNGVLPVASEVDALGRIISLTLGSGAGIPGTPLDNLSPLPRYVRFTYGN